MVKFKKYKVTDARYVEVNDLSFLRERHGYNWLNRHWSNIRCKRACRKADWIIVHSDALKADVVKYYFIPKSKIKVIAKNK